jgi:ubiquinol-cytochrome c reductase cytochrome c1 subunit
MKRMIILFIVALVWPFAVSATSADHPDFKAEVDVSDKASLQRGARTFVNYCMGCHSAAYMRYNRMGEDLGIEESILQSNLMFGTEKSGDTMTIAMQKEDAEKFFGIAAPDLSVIARSRGADWLLTYFMTFYRDSSRPFGVNNQAFKDVAMPHVLWELQGMQKAVYKIVQREDGTNHEVIDHLELETPGLLDSNEYKKAVNDLVNFLVYVGEPAQIQRKNIGVIVILYLLVLLVIVYLLKKEYWKDVH